MADEKKEFPKGAAQWHAQAKRVEKPNPAFNSKGAPGSSTGAQTTTHPTTSLSTVNSSSTPLFERVFREELLAAELISTEGLVRLIGELEGSDRVLTNDLRLPQPFPAGRGAPILLHDAVDPALLLLHSARDSDEALHRWSSTTVAWARALPRVPLEEQTWMLASSCLRATDLTSSLVDTWIPPVLRRFGWDGRPPGTLDEAAALVGKTRERMRQIATKVNDALADRVWIPGADRVMDLVQDSILPETYVLDTLIEEGITATRWHIDALRETLALAGQALSHTDGVVGLTAGDRQRVQRHARRYIGVPGLGTVDDVVELLAEDDGHPFSGNVVRLVVDTSGWLDWADEERGWFVSLSRNQDDVRLRNITRNMLSVSTPLPVATVVDAFERLSAFRGTDATVTVEQAKAFFRIHPEFRLDGTLVGSEAELDYRDVLADSKRRLVDALLAMPSHVGSREDVINAAVDAGVNRSTAGMWLTFAEVIVDHGRYVWGLLGSNPSPERVKEIQASVREQQEPLEFEDSWDADGRFVVSFRVTRSFLNSRTVGRRWPPELREGGDFAASTQGDKHCGIVKFSAEHTFSWGWGPSIAAVGAKRGQRMLATFDLQANRVTVASIAADDPASAKASEVRFPETPEPRTDLPTPPGWSESGYAEYLAELRRGRLRSSWRGVDGVLHLADLPPERQRPGLMATGRARILPDDPIYEKYINDVCPEFDFYADPAPPLADAAPPPTNAGSRDPAVPAEPADTATPSETRTGVPRIQSFADDLVADIRSSVAPAAWQPLLEEMASQLGLPEATPNYALGPAHGPPPARPVDVAAPKDSLDVERSTLLAELNHARETVRSSMARGDAAFTGETLHSIRQRVEAAPPALMDSRFDELLAWLAEQPRRR